MTEKPQTEEIASGSTVYTGESSENLENNMFVEEGLSSKAYLLKLEVENKRRRTELKEFNRKLRIEQAKIKLNQKLYSNKTNNFNKRGLSSENSSDEKVHQSEDNTGNKTQKVNFA